MVSENACLRSRVSIARPVETDPPNREFPGILGNACALIETIRTNGALGGIPGHGPVARAIETLWPLRTFPDIFGYSHTFMMIHRPTQRHAVSGRCSR